MYNSQYYTCEQIDQRLLQGYLDDYNTQNNTNLTKAEFLALLFNTIGRNSTVDNLVTQIGYYECDTAAGTAAKLVTVANYTLFAGGSMKVKFVNKNTANNVTLNINGQGAKSLYYRGEVVSSTNTWEAGEVVEIYYDGTSYYANNVKGGTGDGVFDISKYNLTEGQLTRYSTLSEALGTNGEHIPLQYRSSGMLIKYADDSDPNNIKYVQFRYLLEYENTTAGNNAFKNTINWQGVDEDITKGSKHLIESGSVCGEIYDKNVLFGNIDLLKVTNRTGFINTDSTWKILGNYKSLVVPCVPNAIYEILSNQTYGAVYAFLSELPTFIEGDPVEFANGYDSINGIPIGEAKIVVASDNAKYLYVLAGSYLPVSVKASIGYQNQGIYPTAKIITGKNAFNFYKVGDDWHLKCNGWDFQYVYSDITGIHSRNNLACDINLSEVPGNFKLIYIDKQGNIGATNLNNGVPTDCYLVTICNPEYDIFDNGLTSRTVEPYYLVGDIDISTYIDHAGCINNDGTWLRSATSKFIPVMPGYRCIIKNTRALNSTNVIYAFLSELPTFIEGDPVEFAEGYDSVIGIQPRCQFAGIVPRNAKYLYIVSGSYRPGSVELILDHEDPYTPYKINIKDLTTVYGLIGSRGKWYIDTAYTSVFVPCIPNAVYRIKSNSDLNAIYSVLAEMPEFTSEEVLNYADGYGGRLVVDAGETLDIYTTENAKYLYLTSGSYLPESVELVQYSSEKIPIPFTPVDLLTLNKSRIGIIDDSGNWLIVGNYKSIVEKVVANGVYEIQSSENSHSIYTFLSELPTFISGDPVEFANGYKSIQVVPAGEKKKLVAPSNAKYLYILASGYKPSFVKLIQYSQFSEPHLPYLYDFGQYDKNNGIITYQGEWANPSGYSSIIIPCVSNGIYRIKTSNTLGSVYAFLSELPTFVVGDTVQLADGSTVTDIAVNSTIEIKAPNDAKYLYLLAGSNIPVSVELIGYDNSVPEPEYDFNENYPIIPNDIFVLDDEPTPIFKKSMFKDPYDAQDLVLTTRVDSRLKCFEVGEPLNIEYDKVGSVATLTIEKKSTPKINVFKNINVHKKALSELSGKTAKILMIGDSITHGNISNVNASPIVVVNRELPARYNITPIMIGTFAPRGVDGEGRGCFAYEAMAGSNNNPFGSYHFPSVGGDLETNHSTTTTQFQNPFTFPATAEDKQNHPEWCFTNKNNYPNETDGVSYAEATAEQKSNWHFFIFDFARYLALWNDAAHTPDIITIALGTNDWQPRGVMSIPDIMFAFNIIYSQIRAALPNVKIGIISAQNCAITLQEFMTVSGGAINGNFPDEIAPLITNVQKQIRTYNANGDNNIFEIPLYACGSRWLAFDGNTASASQDISESDNVQKRTIDTNVHLLDGVDSDGYWQYMNGIITAIACLS